MDREQLFKMDSYMLLSIINTKLRDGYDSFNSFCEDIDIDSKVLEDKLKNIGYIYQQHLNQFILKVTVNA